MKVARQIALSLSLVAAFHASLAIPVYAQTSQEMLNSAYQAQDSLFKSNPADLYSSGSDGAVEIIGASPATGDVTIGPGSLYYGAPSKSASSGALPQINTYEDLYSYRNQRLDDLQAGSGEYNGSGGVNAEPQAIQVLRNSVNLPSVSAQEFLFTSRDVLGQVNPGDFSQCIVSQVSNDTTTTYDDYRTERCETSGMNQQPFSATRTFHGPSNLFRFVTSDGAHYCQYGSRRIATDSASTCGQLGIFTTIPAAASGELSARSCGTGCVELVLDRGTQAQPAEMSFTISPQINLTEAQITSASRSSSTWITYQGNNINSNGQLPFNLPEVLTTKGTTQRISTNGVEGTEYTREPATGQLLNFNISQDGFSLISGIQIVYDDRGMKLVNAAWEGDRIAFNRDETLQWTVGDCTYYRGSVSPNSSVIYGLYRICQSTIRMGTLVLRLRYDPRLFSDWNYSRERWSEVQGIIGNGFCRIVATTNSTAANAQGCVNAFGAAGTINQQICGANISVSPFTMLEDRGSTDITLTPVCSSGEDTFETMNNCARYEQNSSCTYIGRSCINEDSSGSCLVYENEYSCGSSSSYVIPSVTEVNVCTGSVSCMGDDCILNTGSDASVDIADTAAKLSAVDMILGDMQCAEAPEASPNPEETVNSCVLFRGERETCAKRVLGLSNCCETPDGVSVAEYLALAISVSRLSRIVEGSSLANPVTSAWVNMTDLGRNSFSELTRPITEVWDSVLGNTQAGQTAANALSMEAVKQTMMKKAAEWVGQTFGEQAANSIFTVANGPAMVGGQVQQGSIGLTQGAATIMNAVMTAYTIYVLINVLASILLACTDDEVELGVKRALKATHEVGTYCSRRVLGACLSRRTSYCVFSSPLSRIMNEQIRIQSGRSWGSPEDPDCSGITVGEFQDIDMDRIDLSEWTGMIMSSGVLDLGSVSDVERLTGTESTLGRGLEDLYERQDAIERNVDRMDGADLDALRKDAVSDFGMGTVQ